MSKPWERRASKGRRGETRPLRDRILIVCEGAKTEPNYFRAFPVKIDVVEIQIQGVGANTVSLVRDAIRRKEDARQDGAPFNQVWCVFDRDEFPAAHFNEAFRLANANGVSIAYSNQCFELWYFLHFDFNDAAIHRHAYAEKLATRLGRKYEKNDPGMYEALKGRQTTAIRNAKKLLSRYSPCCPETDDPSTIVYLLVERLNEFAASESD